MHLNHIRIHIHISLSIPILHIHIRLLYLVAALWACLYNSLGAGKVHSDLQIEFALVVSKNSFGVLDLVCDRSTWIRALWLLCLWVTLDHPARQDKRHGALERLGRLEIELDQELLACPERVCVLVALMECGDRESVLP